MNFNAEYVVYEYDLQEIEAIQVESDYDVIAANIDYNHNIYDWLFVGLGYGFRQGGSSVEQGNYTANSYYLFARATW